MELTMTMGAFEALDQQELFAVDGGASGTIGAALEITAGAVLIAWSPVVGILVGVAGGPPAGVFAAAGMVSLGLSMIGDATHSL